VYYTYGIKDLADLKYKKIASLTLSLSFVYIKSSFYRTLKKHSPTFKKIIKIKIINHYSDGFDIEDIRVMFTAVVVNFFFKIY
jgi:hypothetical protein